MGGVNQRTLPVDFFFSTFLLGVAMVAMVATANHRADSPKTGWRIGVDTSRSTTHRVCVSAHAFASCGGGPRRVPTYATGVVCTRRSPFESTNAGWLLRRLGHPAVAQELVPDHQRHARPREGLTRGVAHVRALFAKSPGCTP